MKKNFKYLVFAATFAAMLTSCEEDTKLPSYSALDLAEDFDAGADNTILNVEGWKNYASAGTVLWKQQVYSGDGYAEFTSFGSSQPVNVGWLITPAFSLAENNNTFLRFRASHSFLTNPTGNPLEVLVSTDYDGTNVEAATWTALDPTLPTPANDYFEYVDSGELSLAAFTGQNAYIAFRVTGSGTDTSLDGSYQVDNVRVYKK